MLSRTRPGRLALAAGVLLLAACEPDAALSPDATAVDPAPSLAVRMASTAGASSHPTLPKATVSTAMPAVTGKTITVPSGGNLQKAIDDAAPGDVIVLKAGATYTGNFTLRKKSGTGWITIRTSASDAQLGAPGTRVSPSRASVMPKIVSPNASPAIKTASGAHHYRIVGVEITAASAVKNSYQLVMLGNGSVSSQSSASQVPSHIVIDRSYIHGRSTMNLKNCVELHSAHTAIVDSYLSECHSAIQESHAIIGWNGPGPFLIENNRIEGAGINVMFGGADPASDAMTPADITIRRNHVIKPLAWKDKWGVKNLLELKIGRRVLVEGNVFENSWVDEQTGFAFVLKTAVGSRASSWGRTEDVTVRHNLIRNAAGGASMSARDGSRGLASRRYRFEHNVWEGIGASNGTTMGRIFQVLPGVNDVQIEHNTAIHATSAARMLVTFGNGPVSGFVFRDNLATHGSYGVKGDGTGVGTDALNKRAPGYVFTHNVIIGGKASQYPATNLFPSATSSVGFVSLSGRDYRLASSSSYRGKASDGTDPGANVAALTAAIAGVAK